QLEGRALGLVENLSAVPGVGVVPQVCPLVDEALAAVVDDQPERVGVLLEEVAHAPVAEGRRVEVPGDGVAGRPVAVGLRVDLERHADAVARVVAGGWDPPAAPARAACAGGP